MVDPPGTAATEVLARRYERLLVAYPPPYRSARGEEIVATLLEAAEPGQRIPRAADVADLVAGGLRQRLGVAAIAGFCGGLVTAAPIAVAFAAGISAFAWWRLEPVAATVHIGGSPLFGEFRTLGPLAYVAWLAAGLASVFLRRAVSRAVIGLAIAVTVVGVPLLAAVTSVERPPLWILMTLTGFGALALAGSGPAAGAPSRPPLDERLGVAAGAVAVALSASAIAVTTRPPGTEWDYYEPTIAHVGAVVGLTIAAVVAVAIHRVLHGRTAHEWLWAAVLLGVPGGWLGPLNVATWGPPDTVVPHFGRLAQVLLTTCVAFATMRWLAQRRAAGADPARVPDNRLLAQAGAMSVGCAAGLAALVSLAAAGLAGFAPGLTARLPVHVTATLTVLVVAGLAAWAPVRGPHPWQTLLAAAGATLAAGWVVAAYANDWTVNGWTNPAWTTTLAATIALVPLCLCAVAAVGVLRRRDQPRTARHTAAVVLAVAAGWLCYLTVPHLLAWGPMLLVFPASFVALAAVDRRRAGTLRGS